LELLVVAVVWNSSFFLAEDHGNYNCDHECRNSHISQSVNRERVSVAIEFCVAHIIECCATKVRVLRYKIANARAAQEKTVEIIIAGESGGRNNNKDDA
jgi:hypothetical protein